MHTATERPGNAPGLEDLIGADAAVTWLLDLVERGTLRPCPALVPSAAMIEEAVTLGKNGFPTVVVDPSEEALARVASLARYQDAAVSTFRRDGFTAISSFVGPELLFDRVRIHEIDPLRTAEWVHVAGRVLPSRGLLVGMFRTGRRPGDEPPHPIALDKLRHLLQRHFATELLEPAGETPPGSVEVWKGIFRRK